MARQDRFEARDVTTSGREASLSVIAWDSPAGATTRTCSTGAEGKATPTERVGSTGSAAFGPQSVHIGSVSIASSTTVHVACLPDAVVMRKTLSTDAAAI